MSSSLRPSTSGRASAGSTEVTNPTQYEDSRGDSTGTGTISGGRRPCRIAKRRIISR